MYNRLKLNIHI